MPKCRDAKLLQVLVRQARKNSFVNLVFAERSLILCKAKAPQPNHDVHDGDPNSGWPHIIILPREGVQDWPRYIVQKSEALQRLTTPSYLRPAALLGIAS